MPFLFAIAPMMLLVGAGMLAISLLGWRLTSGSALVAFRRLTRTAVLVLFTGAAPVAAAFVEGGPGSLGDRLDSHTLDLMQSQVIR